MCWVCGRFLGLGAGGKATAGRDFSRSGLGRGDGKVGIWLIPLACIGGCNSQEILFGRQGSLIGPVVGPAYQFVID